MTTVAEYRTMAAEHHRYAGICRSPEFRERHLSLEQQFLALAKLEESGANLTHPAPTLPGVEDQPSAS
jgi:hypothetical protein